MWDPNWAYQKASKGMLSSARTRQDDATMEGLTTIKHVSGKDRERDTQSAGLVCVGTWNFGSDCTAETQLATKAFHREGLWLSQASVMVESSSDTRDSEVGALSARNASSEREATQQIILIAGLMVLRGATFDLAARRETMIELSILMVWRYTAAAKVAVGKKVLYTAPLWRAPYRVWNP